MQSEDLCILVVLGTLAVCLYLAPWLTLGAILGMASLFAFWLYKVT